MSITFDIQLGLDTSEMKVAQNRITNTSKGSQGSKIFKLHRLLLFYLFFNIFELYFRFQGFVSHMYTCHKILKTFVVFHCMCRNRITTTGRLQTYLFFKMFKLIMESPLQLFMENYGKTKNKKCLRTTFKIRESVTCGEGISTQRPS